MFIHCTKKADKVLRESGIFNDRSNKSTFVKEVAIRDEMFHWHLNNLEVNGADLLLLTHDVSGVAAAFYMMDSVTVKNQLNVFVPPAIKQLFLLAKCSNLFIKEYRDQSEGFVFTSSSGLKQLSKNTVAAKHVNRKLMNLEPNKIFQSQLTDSYNTVPKKSLDYQSPNDVLFKKSKIWLNAGHG